MALPAPGDRIRRDDLRDVGGAAATRHGPRHRMDRARRAPPAGAIRVPGQLRHRVLRRPAGVGPGGSHARRRWPDEHERSGHPRWADGPHGGERCRRRGRGGGAGRGRRRPWSVPGRPSELHRRGGRLRRMAAVAGAMGEPGDRPVARHRDQGAGGGLGHAGTGGLAGRGASTELWPGARRGPDRCPRPVGRAWAPRHVRLRLAGHRCVLRRGGCPDDSRSFRIRPAGRAAGLRPRLAAGPGRGPAHEGRRGHAAGRRALRGCGPGDCREPPRARHLPRRRRAGGCREQTAHRGRGRAPPRRRTSSGLVAARRIWRHWTAGSRSTEWPGCSPPGGVSTSRSTPRTRT